MLDDVESGVASGAERANSPRGLGKPSPPKVFLVGRQLFAPWAFDYLRRLLERRRSAHVTTVRDTHIHTQILACCQFAACHTVIIEARLVRPRQYTENSQNTEGVFSQATRY